MTETAPPERRVAIVTGAARGIGAAIAARLATEGCDVAVVDLDEAACATTVEVVESVGQRGLAVGTDVTDESAVTAAVARVADQLGPPLVLVNNAGVLRNSLMARMTTADWDSVLDVNLKAAFLTSRAVQPHMRAARWGRIVNLASIAVLGWVGQANYSAAKAGLVGFTKTLALELGPHGITANVVAPGFTVTEMTRGMADRIGVTFEHLQEDAVRDIPVGRVGQPDDIANAVAFFTDARSGFVTGQLLYVAGGPRG